MDSLIEQLRNFRAEWSPIVCLKAADKIEELHAENAEMEKRLNEFSEFLCHMTGNLLSKTNYTAQAMISAAEDYQQRVCDDCDKVKVIGNDELIDEYQTIQADLDRVTAERDAAVERLREWEKFETYLLIHNFLTPEKWRGIKED